MRAWTVHRVWSPVSFPILNQSVLYRKVRKVSFSPFNSYDSQTAGTLIKKNLIFLIYKEIQNGAVAK
jgi:hypothetical protein